METFTSISAAVAVIQTSFFKVQLITVHPILVE